MRDTHQLDGHQIDDATHIKKTDNIIEKCIKINVDPLNYGTVNVTI